MTSPIPTITIKRYVDTKPLVKIEPIVKPDTSTDQKNLPEKSSLEELTDIDQLLITRHLHVRSMLLMQGTKNGFCVSTSDQNLIYTIEEKNGVDDIFRWLISYLCYAHRPLQLSVLNNQGIEVMTISRPYTCTARVFPCQLQSLKIFSPPGHLIGSVQQQWSPLKPFYLVANHRAEPVFRVRGPSFTVSFFQDILFEIHRADGEHIGTIYKLWQGLSHALFFAAVKDRFGVSFQSDLSVQEKALLMSVSILMDYMYYDS